MEENNRAYTYRNLLDHYYYEIREEGLYLKQRQLSTAHEYTFSFESITCDPTYYTHRSKVAFWLMVVFVFFFLFGFVVVFTQEDVDLRNFLIWGPGAAVTTAWYFLSRKNYLIFQGPNDSRFSIRFGARHLAEVQAFVSDLEKAKLAYLEDKVKQYLPILGRDGINARIIGLRENTIINKNGYEYLMRLADKLETSGIMGFNKSKRRSPDVTGQN